MVRLFICLSFALLSASCVANNSSYPRNSLMYKSKDYALYKPAKKSVYPQLAKVQLGNEKWSWKIEDAQNLEVTGDEYLTVIPLKDKNIGGIFENGFQSIPILCYHKFSKDKSTPLSTPSHIFDQQMKYLKDNGYRVITPEILLDFLKYRAQIPKKSVLITIDDGYKSVYTIARPILEQYGFTATVFVYTDYVGISKKAMSWDDLKTLKSQGFAIGSHTVAHSDLTQKMPSETDDDFNKRIIKEIFESKKIIDQKLGQKTQYLAFPFGRYNKDLLPIVKSAGYRLAVTVERGSNPFFTNPLALKRDMILKKDMNAFISRLKTFNNLSLK